MFLTIMVAGKALPFKRNAPHLFDAAFYFLPHIKQLQISQAKALL